MRQWIGLIIVLACGYWAFLHFGGPDLFKKPEPKTPQIAWYLENVDYHFSIVQERGNATFFRGYHHNNSSRRVLDVVIKVYQVDGGDKTPVETYRLGLLEPEERKTVDRVVPIPRDGEQRELVWEFESVSLPR